MGFQCHKCGPVNNPLLGNTPGERRCPSMNCDEVVSYKNEVDHSTLRRPISLGQPGAEERAAAEKKSIEQSRAVVKAVNARARAAKRKK